MQPRTRTIALVLVAVLLLTLAALSANEAMANWFFADFHGEPSRWHEQWGNRYALLALILFAAVLYTLRLLAKKKNVA